MSLLLVFLLTVSFLANPSSSATNSFVFGGCSQQKYLPGSSYESKVNSILTSLVNSAMFNPYNNFTVPASSGDTAVYGLFQCRGDLSTNDCAQCVARSVSQLGSLCLVSCGGALQLEGCFVKYDNTTFLGVEDKTVVLKKCGPSNGFDSDTSTRRDSVLGYLGAGDGTYRPYRASGSGNVQGVAQCVGDLSPSECQDCLSEAIGQLRSGCGPSAWGDMFLAKCYVRYSDGGYHARAGDDGTDSNNDDELEKTLAILIGVIAAVGLLVVFLSYYRKYLWDDDDKCGK